MADFKYLILTFGCQMNKSDSERIEGLLLNMGLKEAGRAEEADIIILNTCSVRQTAEDRVYGLVRNFKRLKRKNPHLLVAVTGCVAGRDKDGKIKEKMPGVDFFFPISDLPRLPELILEQWARGAKRETLSLPKGSRQPDSTVGCETSYSKKADYLGMKPKAKEWWRGSVVIQTGCSNYCTYCVVPYARGHEKNRPVAAILKEAREMAKNGAREIILLGQTVNSHPKFVEILEKVNIIPGVNRVSFASAHPMHMTDGVIKALRLPKMMNYLHLPVQSGNDEILRKMNRNYTRPVRNRPAKGEATTASERSASNGAREKYLKIISKIKKIRPEISLATDIIVGFPGETKKQFADTVSLYKKCDFDLSYNAMYSPRTGTAAFRAFADDVPREEKRRRWIILQKLMEKTALRKNKKFIGKKVEVLVDGCDGKKCFGFSREYKRVVFPEKRNLAGEIINVKIESAKEWELKGIIAN